MPKQYEQKPGSRLYLMNYLNNSMQQVIKPLREE